MLAGRAYILCTAARRQALYASWMVDCPVPCEVVEHHTPDWSPPADALIVITHLHYRWEEVHILRRLLEDGRVPTLVLADGVLDYRNTFEHRILADGAVFQPVMGHKLACIGRSQARVVGSWGNARRCEVVGLPRLDPYLRRPAFALRREGPFRLLIATARQPFFDDSQRQTLVRSLRDLQTRLAASPEIAGRPAQVSWRITSQLDRELGVTSEASDDGSLLARLDEVDAVVTTPSTLQVEAALRGRPVAVLDYAGEPQFVPVAWTIAGADHIGPVLQELASPPPPKLLFQQTVLHDTLECRTPAKPRLHRLIETMARCGLQALVNGTALVLPASILSGDEPGGGADAGAPFDAARLYPNNSAFQVQDVSRLQAELAQARRRLDELPEQLIEARQQVRRLKRELTEEQSDRTAPCGGFLRLERRFNTFLNTTFAQHRWELEMRDRDLIELLTRITPLAPALNVELRTEHPVATGSVDHRHPHGTAQDNTRAPWFVARCEELLGPCLTALDLGCAGGGLVFDFTLRGHRAVGLEGSDYSQKRMRAEWRLLGDRLFTCDVAQPFELIDADANRRMSFDVITAWDVMEHFPSEQLEQVLANVQRHLAPSGLFVGSISTRPAREAPDGVNYHGTVRPRSWWLQTLREGGFEPWEPTPFDHASFARGNASTPMHPANFARPQAGGLHFVVRSSQLRAGDRVGTRSEHVTR